ncbi:hypothetical protein Pint_27084 [Pistacia integerrima]|uniref:Uncharacterized protein n=1 Tax=Pistacia integerrima TaxID=434235 RepID=A0ACC0YSH4_9ROSI|nr:hypothetical protein Pint_27084 [Pistacia integerrima]
MNSLLCYCLSGSADGLALFSCNPYGKFLFSLGNRGPDGQLKETLQLLIQAICRKNVMFEYKEFVSASMYSNARATLIEDKKKSGISLP